MFRASVFFLAHSSAFLKCQGFIRGVSECFRVLQCFYCSGSSRVSARLYKVVFREFWLYKTLSPKPLNP